MCPVYNYECQEGHVFEKRAGYDVLLLSCACGEAAVRQAVYSFNLGGGPQPKYRVSEFREAAQEANYYHGRMENLKGEPMPRIDVTREAKREARRRGAKVKV